MDSRIDYSRQASFDQKLSNIYKEQINYIVGCGGVGFWLGLILAMQGCTRFVLIDGQTIDRSNLNRLPVPPTWVGQNKAIALRKIIRMVRPLTVVRTVTEHIQEDTFDILLDGVSQYKTVWDCTDDARIQKKIFKAMKSAEQNIAYRKIGYEGFQVGSYKEYDVWIPSDYAPGYRTANACAATSALAAVMGMMSEGLDIREDIEFNVANYLQNYEEDETPLSPTIEGTIADAMERLQDVAAASLSPLNDLPSSVRLTDAQQRLFVAYRDEQHRVRELQRIQAQNGHITGHSTFISANNDDTGI